MTSIKPSWIVVAFIATALYGAVLILTEWGASRRTGASKPPSGWHVVIRHASMILFAGLSGAVSGWVAEWLGAFLSMGLTGAGYSDTLPQWDVAFAVFSANVHGVPFGTAFGIAGYVGWLRRLEPSNVVRAVPLLFAATLAGAVVGFGLGPARALSAAMFFFGACHFLRVRGARESRESAGPIRAES